MAEEEARDETRWHGVWHMRYLKSEIESFLKHGRPSLKETAQTIKDYLANHYVSKTDIRNVFFEVATTGSFSWTDDGRIRFRLLKNEFNSIL